MPIAAAIAKAHGMGAVFTLFVTFNMIAALLALFVLKPMRARHFAEARSATAPPPRRQASLTWPCRTH